MEPVILASASPRRQDFFRLMALPFTCIPAEIDETPQSSLTPRQVAEDLALRKAMAVVERIGKEPQNVLPPPTSHCSLLTAHWILGADTIVVLKNEIFGKPDSREAAKTMLERLSGQTHEVISAMALYNGHKKSVDCRSVVIEVTFAPLSGTEIEWYLDTNEWEGVAGAYRLQGLGALFIESIKGSPSGVAGLPLFDFYAMLKANGYPFGA